MPDAAPLMMSHTLAATGPTSLAIDLLVILACAGVVALFFGRLRVAVIPGYLVAGALIGPHALGLVGDQGQIEGIASLATVLLMFGIGMHLDASMLRRGATVIIAVGVVTTVLSTGLIMLGARALGVDWRSAAVIGMALSLSSTAVVLRILQQRRELFTAPGRVSLGVLLVQDLMVIAMLASIPLLAGSGDVAGELEHMNSDDAMLSVGDAAISVAVVLGIILAGKLLLPKVMVEASRSPSPEIMLVISAAAALGAAVATAAVGLSPELGAFLAGFLLSGTPFRYQLAGQITPLRDLFMAVFFTTVGLEVALDELAQAWWVVVAAGLGVMAVKSLVIGGVTWVMGASSMISGRVGVWLSQGGEFSLIILSVASTQGVIGETEEARTIGVIVLTLIVTPALIGRAASIVQAMPELPMAPWGARSGLRETPSLHDADTESDDRPDAKEEPETRVLIAGFGPVGRACAEQLERARVPFTILELNAKTVRTQLALGRRAYYGDVTNQDVLEHAGIYNASAVVLTMPDQDAMFRAVRTIRSMRPDVYIAARAGVMSASIRAREMGADEVVVEELASAELMATRVIKRLHPARNQGPDTHLAPMVD